MKPKLSTGYFTPQANRLRRVSTPVRSESNDDLNALNNLNESFFENLLNCPVKRQLILNLISSEKENIKKYKQKQAEEQKRKEFGGSPLLKIKKNYQCESPTALLRRRALEQQAHENQSDGGSRSSSRQSISSSSSSPIPFEKLLDGVVAYVEIRSKDKDQDRSSGAKALMRSMGAVVRDQFTKDVTHVIFKDGSFTTYQRANLLKVHLVSVLWIEAVRSSHMRVPERKFPALGTEAYDHNVSSLCSQMQKDYEEIIREEVHRSLAAGTPLPSRKSYIDRRRTIMTPLLATSSQLSQDLPSTQDMEVEQIVTMGKKTRNYRSSTPSCGKLSHEIVSDEDSDLGPCINGSIINRKKHTQDDVINSIENLPGTSSMEFTYIESSLLNEASKRQENTKIGECDMEIATLYGRSNIDETVNDKTENSETDHDSSIYNKCTPKMAISKNSRQSCQKMSDSAFSIPDENLYRRRTRQLKLGNEHLSDGTPSRRNDVDEVPLQLVEVSGYVQVLSKNACINTEKTRDDNCSTSMSSLQVLSEKHSTIEKSTSTNMSSLHVSGDSNSKEQTNLELHKGKDKTDSSANTNMSSLHISTLNKSSDKSTETNMSALIISSDSSKIQNNIDIQKNNNDQITTSFNKDGSMNKISESRAHENSFNSTGDSFSPLNMRTIKDVLETLNENPKSDENVTRRRRGRPRKSTVPSNSVDVKLTDVSSPPKQFKKSPVHEIVSKTNTDTDRRRTLRGRIQNTDISSRKTLGTRRKTLLPFHPTINSESSDKDDNGSRKSSEVLSNPEVSNNERFLREKRNAIKEQRSCSQNNKTQINKSSSEESNGSDKKRRMRKLYNPDDSVTDVIVSDEKEREHKRIQVRKRKSDEGVIFNPNIVSTASNVILTNKAKEFVEENRIDIEAILHRDLHQSQNDDGKKASKKGRKKKQETQIVCIDSDADEQKELAEELMGKKKDTKVRTSAKKSAAKSEGRIDKRRQSTRLSQHPRKVLNFDSSGDEKKVFPKTHSNRRSTMEFQSLSQRSVKNKLKIDKTKQPSIVCTRLHKDEVQVFHQIVKKLGCFVTEDEVSEKTTHLVAGEPKRTVNMLRAMARGCWILKYEWVLKSLEEERWLPEEDYEDIDFSPAVQKCRLQRQAFGPSYSMDIFQDCGPIYIARGTNPRCSDLRELVSLCKGKVVTIPRNASIVVGEYVRYEGIKCVKETWLLDSITFSKKMPFKKYIITAGDDNFQV